MSEYDANDAIVERTARQEQDELDRQHGQFLLDAAADSRERREQGADPLFEILNRAHQAKVEDDKA